ncbi:hypothetical protein FGE12_22705 [Aggregicoccus sp. 17bor-14]|uniref:hypothetical protein n=1 Tax=Myxococcaceae TaxID=31 RepID=UPI00129D07A9|nr:MULTISPECIES: hypothetical protein [Myxococcaceae]MBF5045233.1 hypothetical protein [Simulacricoccus sp. 17bor-14]MRI90974.1 hypothetical protein [Aggregicoccus sp. 17bor-14]
MRRGHVAMGELRHSTGAAETGYVGRLEAELRAADDELAELERSLQLAGGAEDVPELAWARARWEALGGWVQALHRRDGRAAGQPFTPEDSLHAHAEGARSALLRARLEVHERLQLLRQDLAFRAEAHLRALEDGYARAEAEVARSPHPSAALGLSLAWLRCELHATWRLLERMLRSEDREWARTRRDFERALEALSHSAQRLLPAERVRYA